MAVALAISRAVQVGFHKVRSTSAGARHAQTAARSSKQENAAAQQQSPAAAYVHLPFCKKKCHYCDFPVVALGSSATNQESSTGAMERYVHLLCKEISSTRPKSCSSVPLKTVFFGGGTPSLIPPELLRIVVHELRSKHGFDEGHMEISMEMDPGTFDRDHLMHVVDCGVTRVSLGVQVFDDELLSLCGRSHTLEQVYQSIDWIRSSTGIVTNWSLDLISSLPHQSLTAWEHSLSEAIAAGPSHVSVYDLQIEQGTKFGNVYKPGTYPLPSDDESAGFYRLASSTLGAAGYEHYEISNYAKDGFRCRHNLVYWKNLGYYAYGLGSTSYVHGRRFTRSRRMKEYAEYVERLSKDEKVIEEAPVESLEDRVLDTVMLSLRLAEGIDLRKIEADFGRDVRACLCEGIREFVTSKHAEFLDETRQPLDESDSAAYVRLTDPEGFLLSNEIISRLFTLLPDKPAMVTSS